jgi:hypothetical protein
VRTMLRVMADVVTRRLPTQLTRRSAGGNSSPARAFNSAVEWHLHTVQVVGSIPTTPTKFSSEHAQLRHRQLCVSASGTA